eukprot:TRINITY_DN17881_c0_g1_i1.p1 TRINITY_DN17881_c0_g1~~TRINITY_DN17881_c0_g1_i1.p1  ORF type:complete len:761 (-),score=187.03 TRINITY_DN17881_c0_g1_i1:108-2390(-)
MRVFVNNVDGYLAGAVCADLYKLSHNIVGTRKSRVDELVPPMVKRIVPRLEVRRLLKTVASSDVVVYDLHDADLEELELVLRTLHISEITQDLTFILISSIGCWARTQRVYETVPAPPAAEKEAAADGEGEGEGEHPPAAEEGEGEEGDAAGEQAEPEAPPPQRPMPLRSEDYTRRIPAPKFQEWKSIETVALALRDKPNVKPYVVCSGIPYGNGEDAFLGLFKAAWQTRSTLRYIGDGNNYIPLVHSRDVARLVRNIVEKPPSLEYHIAVDRGNVTQKELIEGVAQEFGIPYPITSVSVAEAVLAELADILTLDLRMVPSALMDVPYVPPPEPVEATEEGEGDHEHTAASLAPPPSVKETVPVTSGDAPQGLPFRWWAENGIRQNMSKVTGEFCKWRRLDPVRVLLVGPPCCGNDKLGMKLAERYNIPFIGLGPQVEELKSNADSPLGQQVKESSDQVVAALANPKAQGPFILPAAICCKVIEAALECPPARFRGSVITGFPNSAEEVTEFFLEDAPPPPPPENEEEAPAEPEAPVKIFRKDRLQDVVVFIKSTDEACKARNESSEKPLGEKEFDKQMDRWKNENPEEGTTLIDLFREKTGEEPLCIDIDEVEPTDAVQTIVTHLQGKRAICNFMPPPRATDEDDSKRKLTEDVNAGVDEALMAREAEEKRKQKEWEEKMELIKKDELQRLEKHSEPLRNYLMSLVVPTLTSGLIEVCRDVPEDPVGYLAEYLATYSQISKERAKAKKAAARLAEPSSA